MFLMIGLPVFQREWILPFWFEAIERQTFPLEDIGFCFVVAPDDEPTIEVLYDWHAHHPQVRCFEIVPAPEIPHTAHPPYGRLWQPDRYHAMVALRNKLLNHVVVHDPDRFFSLDSDILIERPDTIERLLEMTDELDAVSPLTFMTPVMCKFPSTMTWAGDPGGGAVRKERNDGTSIYPMGTVFRTDIIMAAKMMTRPVYQRVRYQWHRQGEDLGWSFAAWQQGFRLYCASNVYCPHVMHTQALEEYRAQGDARGEILFEVPVPTS